MNISRLSICLDGDYPCINWNRHGAMSDLWLEIDDRHKAGRPIKKLLSRIEYQVRLNSRWPRVDCVRMVPGLAISKRAKAAFESLGVPGMHFVEFRINGEPFFRFYTDRLVYCLDRSRSEIRFFPSSPDRIMDVTKYAFFEDRLQSCDVFTLPELSDGMFFWSQQTFFTEQARSAIERSGLIGFRFEALSGQSLDLPASSHDKQDTTMSPVFPDSVVVSTSSCASDDPSEIVQSNVSFVNLLLEEYLTPSEVSADALRSYYVDYYLAEVENGGFSQFVYNSRWEPRTIGYVREGLRAIGARRHLVLFDEGARLVARFTPDELAAYLAGEYFGENEDRDRLNAINNQFFQASEKENLLALNAAWLRRLPNLVRMTPEEMAEEARRRGVALPDREQRIREARANEPPYMKVIRALCERAGQELKTVTAGDPTRVHQGVRTLAWHFITDKGHHHMIEVAGRAIMFRGHSTTDRVCELTVPEQPATGGTKTTPTPQETPRLWWRFWK